RRPSRRPWREPRRAALLPGPPAIDEQGRGALMRGTILIRVALAVPLALGLLASAALPAAARFGPEAASAPAAAVVMTDHEASMRTAGGHVLAQVVSGPSRTPTVTVTPTRTPRIRSTRTVTLTAA